MKTLGVDQSFKSCGIVVLESDNCVDYDIFKKNEKNDVFANAADIAQKIGQKVLKFNPDMIILEGLSFGNLGNMTRDLAGLQFAIMIHLRYHIAYNNPIIIVPPPTLKKFATGNGRAEKQDMINNAPDDIRNTFIKANYKKTTGLSDLVDAYWLAKYGQLNHSQDK